MTAPAESVSGVEAARAGFHAVFGEDPAFVVRAPGRVNLIGDHTDYNDGLVLPFAIEIALYLAAGSRPDPILEVHADRYANRASIAFDEIKPGAIEPAWLRYAAGVVPLLQASDVDVPGLRVWIGGELPDGAGLSSSAAVEVGVATALLQAAGASLPPLQLAELCQRAENVYADSPCGLMDQLCCVAAEAGHALQIDCRTRAWEQVPLRLDNCVLLVIDSGVRHSVATGEYRTRRQECERALETLRREKPALTSLREVSRSKLISWGDRLGSILGKRVAHVVNENARVAAATAALHAGDLDEVGRLMHASHESLRDDYDVSCPEMDELVDLIAAVPGVRGVRMTGGGFGGSAIALASTDSVEPLYRVVERKYNPDRSTPASIRQVSPSDGVRVM
jgi:galactokinase